MHLSSFMKAEAFVKTYVGRSQPPNAVVRVIEIGSKTHTDVSYKPRFPSYKPLFPKPLFEYVGLDIEPGPNVDIVPKNGFVWPELANNSFDLAISGQTFEHNPFFWVTFCEIAQILKPGGYLFVVAPGGGVVHRYPYDCWRFYPDAWFALCTLSGMKLVESYFETDATFDVVEGGGWRDSAVIAVKPMLEAELQSAFNARLAELVSPYAAFSSNLGEPRDRIGPCFRSYEDAVRSKAESIGRLRKIKRMIRRLTGIRSPLPIFRRQGD